MRKILTSKRCLALLQGPEGFFAVGERHTYLNGPTVTLRPIPALVWQRGEGLDGVVVKPSINHLVGARAGEDRPCAGWVGGEKKFFPADGSHVG